MGWDRPILLRGLDARGVRARGVFAVFFLGALRFGAILSVLKIAAVWFASPMSLGACSLATVRFSSSITGCSQV